jgi:protein gp37
VAKNSSIEWTHHTFNPWWGCVRVSSGCKHCYAETWAKRIGMQLWGTKARRRFFSDAHWSEPLTWNREAEAAGERRRVFCASMADVFENRADLEPWRERLWNLIEKTPGLDWLLLTKRPECIGQRVPWTDTWPHNVWLGTTAENQHWANKRLDELRRYAARVLFVSAEPLIGALNLRPWLVPDAFGRRIHWVIAGGESGARARPMNPEWARDLRDQCEHAGVAFHFKQWGHWSPDGDNRELKRKRVILTDTRGQPVTLIKLGKKASGRLLDGRTWDGLPQPRNEA